MLISRRTCSTTTIVVQDTDSGMCQDPFDSIKHMQSLESRQRVKSLNEVAPGLILGAIGIDLFIS